jgi:diacylglycerol kinase family enzyme
VAAWIALVALVSAIAFLIVEAVSRWDVLLVTVLSLAMVVVAAWYALSRRGRSRVVALVVGALSLVLFAVVVLASESLRVLLVGLVLAAVAIAAARFALQTPKPGPSLRDAPGPSEPVAPRATHPVLLMNLRSGGGKAERFDLVGQCRSRGIEPIVLTPGSDLLELATDAVRRGADLIGMAGGDGSQALVASVASRAGLPFVVIPAGTRNHFALDLGIDREDVVGALDAYQDGVDRVIDLAEVNGRVFVNNASLGVYAKIVQSEEYRDAKVQTAASLLPDLIGPDATPLDLRFTLLSGDEASTAQLVLVSNNPYELAHLRGAGTRARIDGGVLGILSVMVRGAADAQKLAALEATGQVRRFSGWDEWTASELEVRSGSPIDIGVDGEAMTLEPPLRFVIRPGALTVRLPRSALARPPAADAVRLSSRGTLAALWRIALGRTSQADR